MCKIATPFFPSNFFVTHTKMWNNKISSESAFYCVWFVYKIPSLFLYCWYTCFCNCKNWDRDDMLKVCLHEKKWTTVFLIQAEYMHLLWFNCYECKLCQTLWQKFLKSGFYFRSEFFLTNIITLSKDRNWFFVCM